LFDDSSKEKDKKLGVSVVLISDSCITSQRKGHVELKSCEVLAALMHRNLQITFCDALRAYFERQKPQTIS